MDKYMNNKLKFPLTEKEYNIIDKVWTFYKDFNFMTITHYDYRNKVINKIKKKYSLDEFYQYEQIIEKLYWNMKNQLTSIESTSIESTDLSKYPKYKEYSFNDFSEIFDKFYDDNNFRSYINKVITIDDINNTVYYKKNEGTINIFEKNKLNQKIGYLMSNRTIYEKVLEEPKLIDKIKSNILPKIYRQLDYAFPNFSLIKPNIGSQEWRKNKIKHMYYYDNSENNWFVLFK